MIPSPNNPENSQLLSCLKETVAEIQIFAKRFTAEMSFGTEKSQSSHSGLSQNCLSPVFDHNSQFSYHINI